MHFQNTLHTLPEQWDGGGSVPPRAVCSLSRTRVTVAYAVLRDAVVVPGESRIGSAANWKTFLRSKAEAIQRSFLMNSDLN